MWHETLSQTVQSAIDSSGTVLPLNTRPCSVHFPCIYPGSLLGLFPLPEHMSQGCIFIQGPKIMYN